MSGVLLFDGDCSFCTSSARLATKLVTSATVAPWQESDLDALGVRAEDAAASLHWVDADGRVSAGAEAIARFLLTGNVLLRVLAAVLLLPGIRSIAQVVYRIVANNRSRLPGGTPACRVD